MGLPGSLPTLRPVTTAVAAQPVAPSLSPGQLTRQRLDHVDAMRPVKQAGVVATHSILALAPAGSGLAAGAALMLLHVTREAFLFISACMLTYSYYELKRHQLKRFYRRRCITVGVPYLCWTVIYFLEGLHGSSLSALGELHRFGFLLLTGYYQLYFLVVLIQFYLLFPLFLWLLHKTEGHHGLLLVASAGVQLLYIGLMRWAVLPASLTGFWATREVMSYQFYLVAGGLAAAHYTEFDAWVRRNWRMLLGGLVLTAAVAEVWYFLEASHTFQFGSGLANDPFQPIVVPWNVAAILVVYLVGVSLVSPSRSPLTVSLAHRGSDDAYGVYLAQMLFIDLLVGLGWRHLNDVVPWPLLMLAAVALVFFASCVLTELLARTRLAEPLTGRKQVPWPARLRSEPRRREVTAEAEAAPGSHRELAQRPPG
jgi:peptidoglycan/LPS O-acetylase OafA/YrhL